MAHVQTASFKQRPTITIQFSSSSLAGFDISTELNELRRLVFACRAQRDQGRQPLIVHERPADDALNVVALAEEGATILGAVQARLEDLERRALEAEADAERSRKHAKAAGKVLGQLKASIDDAIRSYVDEIRPRTGIDN